MPDDIIHCRLPADTLKRLDAQIDRLRGHGVNGRVTRSRIVRTLLCQQLADDPNAAVLADVFSRSDDLMSRIVAKMTTHLLTHAQTTLASNVDGVAEEVATMTMARVTAEAVTRTFASFPDVAAKIAHEVTRELLGGELRKQ